MPDWDLRPARDHGLGTAERMRSHGREQGLGSLAIAAAWRKGLRLYLRAMHQLEIVGADNLPAAPFVIVANHSSHLDALSVAAALPGPLARKAFALAAGDTFFNSFASAAFASYAVNALPVWRKQTTARDLDGMRQRLTDDGAVLILFPEGTRTRTGEMGRFKPGVGALVAGRDIPVVPCFLDGAFAAWPPSRRLPRRGRLRLTIGAPLRFAELEANRNGMMKVAQVCEAAVRALDTTPKLPVPEAKGA